MIRLEGYCWPDTVGDKWRHALMHVKSIEWAIARSRQHRTAVQAGGNVGLWPRRLGLAFDRVVTFEPDPISRECLALNVGPNVEVHAEALGAGPGTCAMKRKGLGSHRILEGDGTPMITVDSLNLPDLDLLQFDLEGYEWHALAGAMGTLARCRPVVQVELRNMSTKYGQSDTAIVTLLAGLGYRQVSRQQGSDVVFEAK